MSRVAAGVALAILFLVCLLALAPARLLNAFLPGERVIVQGYSGTVWRGAANRALLAANGGYIHLGKINWTLNPLSLLTFSPALNIESSWGRQHINTGVRLTGLHTLELTDVDALVPVQLLRQFLPLALAGDFSVQAQHLTLENGLPTQASGRVVWRNAAWMSSQGLLSLGTYAIEFQQEPGQALYAEVLTLAGSVRVNGSVQLLGKDYALDILISSDAGLDAQLEQALSLVAQPVADGRRIKFEGQLL